MPQPAIKLKRAPTGRRKDTAKTNLERQREYLAKRRDVTYGPPECEARRTRMERDPEKWLRYYLADTFYQPFAPVHKSYIRDLSYIVEHGGWKSVVLPRGSGKTTIAQGMAFLSTLTGKTQYAVMIACDSTSAKNLLQSFKTWLLWNDRLAADYPEVVAPIRHSKGIPQATNSMTAFGEPIYLKWTSEIVILPNAPRVDAKGNRTPAASANAVIDCDGITGSIRGRKAELPDGRTLRPDLAIVDDPQTAESARAPLQVRRRLETIKSDVALLAGPGKDMRIIVPATIIERNDLADEISDPARSPDFIGERYPFFISMPENMELWEDYNAARVAGLEARDGGKSAKAFYRANRKELDKGAKVVWPTRHGDNSISGIQWGMDQYFKLGPKSFFSELQGQPIQEDVELTIEKLDILKCEIELARMRIPEAPIAVTAFIDCNPRTSGLHWSIVSFHPHMTPHTAAYGRYPKRGTLVPKGASDSQEEAMLFEGLRVVCSELAACRLIADGEPTPSKIDILLIDMGYKPEVVRGFCKAASLPFQIHPDGGRGSSKYYDQGNTVVRARQHVHQRRNASREKYLLHNADAIRETAQRSFVAGAGCPGGMSIHKGPAMHEEFAEHIASTKLMDKAQGEKGVLYKWGRVPGSEDHWLDCIVGCYAGAYWLGLGTDSTVAPKPKRRAKMRVTM